MESLIFKEADHIIYKRQASLLLPWEKTLNDELYRFDSNDLVFDKFCDINDSIDEPSGSKKFEGWLFLQKLSIFQVK